VADELQIRDTSRSPTRKRKIAVTLKKPRDVEKVSGTEKRVA